MGVQLKDLLQYWCLSFLALSTAQAQFQSGSLVVAYYSKDEIVVAADSRSTRRPNGPPEDCYCKVAAVHGRILFASAGVAESFPERSPYPIPKWSNLEEARRAFDIVQTESPGEVQLDKIANRWGATIVSYWEAGARSGSHAARQIAEKNNGIITQAFWGGFDKYKRPVVLFTEVRFDPLSESPIAHRTVPLEGPPNDFFAFGETELVRKQFKGISDKAKVAAARLKPPNCFDPRFPRVLRAVGLINLTITSGKEPSVGGAVDAVRLGSDGSICWVARKSNCRED